MKKFTFYLALLPIILTSCSQNNVVDNNKEEPPVIHEHTYSEEWSYDDLYHFHRATCEHSDLFIDKEEHTYGEWVIDKDPTYTKEGVRHRTCSICGYNQLGSIEVLQETDENALDIPIFYINTENSAPIVSKEEYVNATMNITNAKDYNTKGLTLGIRGRGNYSWSGTEKKSYRIKFDKKQQPLGQGKGKAKSWTLLAVHCDKSLLRTDAAFYFANKLENIPFVSSSSFVELWLNNEYQGVYELCDQIQVNEYRVNIDDSGSEEDIGYLVELDKNASEDVITLNSGLTFEVKSDYQNSNQLAFITNYLNQCESAIKGGNKETISNLIDLPSVIDAYIVEELFKNLDVGWGSFYYTKPAGDKLYFGPVWDFDLTSGNADSDTSDMAFTSPKYTYVGNQYFSNYMQQHTWYTSLRKQDWFNEMIATRWNEVKDYALETIEHINLLVETNHRSFERNFTHWDIFDQKINREPRAVMNIKTFDGQVEYLTNWLNQRITWLDAFYKGEEKDITKWIF